MQPSIGIFGALEALKDRLVFVELPLLNLNIDPDDVLPHDSPGTDIQMSACFAVMGPTEGQT